MAIWARALHIDSIEGIQRESRTHAHSSCERVFEKFRYLSKVITSVKETNPVEKGGRKDKQNDVGDSQQGKREPMTSLRA